MRSISASKSQRTRINQLGVVARSWIAATQGDWIHCSSFFTPLLSSAYTTISFVARPLAPYPKTTSSCVNGSTLGCVVNVRDFTWPKGSYMPVSRVFRFTEYSKPPSSSTSRRSAHKTRFVFAVESTAARTHGWCVKGFRWSPNSVLLALRSNKYRFVSTYRILKSTLPSWNRKAEMLPSPSSGTF